MKLSLLPFLLAIGACTTAYGQDEDVLRPKGRPASLGPTPSRSASSSLPVTIGLEGGINLSFFSQSVSGALETSPIQTFTKGFGLAPYASMFVDVGITPTVGVQLRAAYDRKSYGNSEDAIIDCTLFDEYGQPVQITTTPVNVDYTSAITYITVSPQVRWEPVSRLVLLAGPTVQFRGSAMVTEASQNLGQHDACFFPGPNGEQLKSRVVNDTVDDSSALNSLRLGAEFSLAYRLPLSTSIDLVPRLGYQFMFTAPAPAGNPVVDDSRTLTLGQRIVTPSEPTLHSLQAVLGLWVRL